jgi:predicted nucleic acid-binding protein
MIILDTNVVSETIRRLPNPRVVKWLDDQREGELFLCTPVLAELRYGQERLPEGTRKTELRSTIDRFEKDLFHGRILEFSVAATLEYGRIAAARERTGRKIEGMDIFIAAIARVHGAIIATRNFAHFDGVGVELINPFEAAR